MIAPATVEYDWPTLRAVAARFDLDPRELEQDLQRPPTPPTHGSQWCVMPVANGYGHRRSCTREGHYSIGPLNVCGQHEGVLVGAFVAWASEVRFRDLDLLVQTIADRLRCLRWAEENPRHTEPEEARASVLLRRALTEYLDTEVRSALRRVWSEPA